MNFIRRAMIIFSLSQSYVYAAGTALHIGVDDYNPPFSLQTSGNEFYGFDIEIMNSLCKIMNRSCIFHKISFDKLLRAVQTKQVDLAIGSLTITSERAALVNFSLPYLLSYSRFIGNFSPTAKESFSLSQLNNTKIGVESGTVFSTEIKRLRVINPSIKQYKTIERAMAGLKKKEIDYVLLNNSTAKIWTFDSKFSAYGKPFLYGNGFGIAVNKNEKQLLQEINHALVKYQDSKEYQISYSKYFKIQ